MGKLFLPPFSGSRPSRLSPAIATDRRCGFGGSLALNVLNGRLELAFRNAIWTRQVLALASLALLGNWGSQACWASAGQEGQGSSGSGQAADKGEKTSKQEPDKSSNQTQTSKENLPASGAAANQQVYNIGVEDELQISVWHEPELSTTVVVRPDGMITLPLVNDIKVAGLKPEQLQALLIDKLKGFINEPQVTVVIRAIRSRKASLVGQVPHPGAYPLNGNMTVLDLLAAGGGIGIFAKGESIYILRDQDGKKVRIPFHYKKALAGKGDNPVLFPGDLVVVP